MYFFKKSKVQNYIICHHLWIKSVRGIFIYIYICMCIKYPWEDTQEIGNDGCLSVGVLESGDES